MFSVVAAEYPIDVQFLVVRGSRKLTQPAFQTLVAETEDILNSRPSAYEDYDLAEKGPLTPNHYEMQTSHICFKPLECKSKWFSIKNYKKNKIILTTIGHENLNRTQQTNQKAAI